MPTSTRVIALGIGLALLHPASGQSPAIECPLLDRQIQVEDRLPDQLTIGYRVDAAPFSYADESGEPAGYSVGLCTALAEALVGGDRIDYVVTTSNDRFPDLATGKIDLLCDSSTLTWQRAACFDHTLLTFPSGPALAVTPPTTDSQPARTQRVGVLSRPSSTAATADAPGASNAIGRALGADAVTLVHLDDYAALFEALVPPSGAERRLDAIFADREILLAYAQRYPGRINVKNDYFRYEPYAIYLRPNRALRLALDRELARLFATPRIHELLTDNFKSGVTETVGQLIKLQRIPER